MPCHLYIGGSLSRERLKQCVDVRSLTRHLKCQGQEEETRSGKAAHGMTRLLKFAAPSGNVPERALTTSSCRKQQRMLA